MFDKDESISNRDSGARIEGDDVTQAEYAELARLVEAELDGGDAVYVAFSSLCPTMREGEFDEGACMLYGRLRDAGMLSGESDGGGFYFTGLTDRGRDFVLSREKDGEGVFGPAWVDRVCASPQLADEGPADSDAASSNDATGWWTKVDKNALVPLVAICVVVGFIAGIAGGLLGAYLMA